MQKGKIVFTGNFWEYFGTSLLLFILSVITLGIFLPFFFYWSFRYFFTKMEIEMYGNASPVQVRVDRAAELTSNIQHRNPKYDGPWKS